MGWPVYYSGQSPDGGHAFVCDGYNDANLFHYNWGWGGSGDGWFDFDNIDYNTSDGAIFNFVPTDVYNGTPKAPTNLTVTPADNNVLSATLTWTNPSQTLNNANLGSITQIVVCRDGEVIYTWASLFVSLLYNKERACAHTRGPFPKDCRGDG